MGAGQLILKFIKYMGNKFCKFLNILVRKFRKVIRKITKPCDYLYEYGLDVYYNDNLDESITYFQQALALNPKHFKAKEMLLKSKQLKVEKEYGNFLFNHRKYELAKQRYNKALQIDPSNNSVNCKLYYNRGLVHSHLGNPHLSIADCVKAFQLNGKYLKPLLLQAKCLINLERLNEVEDIAEKLLQINPNSANGHYVLGLRYYYDGDLDKSKIHFERALIIDQNCREIQDIHLKTKNLKEKKEKGNSLFNIGKFNEAKIAYTEALQIDSLNKKINSTLYYNRALVNSKLQNIRESVCDCTKALELNKNYLKAFLLRTKCYIDLKDYDKCIKDCDIAFETFADCIKFNFLKAESLVLTGRTYEARRIIEKTAKIHQNSAESFYVLGLCYYYNGDLIKSTKYLKETLNLNKNLEKATSAFLKSLQLKKKKEKGSKLFKSGQFVEAKIAYTEALQIDLLNKNVNSTLYYNRALANSKLGNLQQTIADCTQALQINTKYLKAILLRAKCYNDLQQYYESFKDYEIAIEIAPEFLTYKLFKAECLLYLGCIDEAHEIVRMAMKTRANDAETFYVYGLCRLHVNDLNGSIEYFEKAYKLNLNHDKAKMMYDNLTQFKEINEKGDSFFKSGRFKEAKDSYTEALQFTNLNKDMYKKLYYDRALVNFKMENFHESIADCSKAIESNVEFLEALFLRAECFSFIEEYNDCIKDCNTVLKIDANHLKCKILKVECLIFLRRATEAQNFADEAMKTDPNCADVNYIYGLCLYYKDDLIKSISHFKRSLQLFPNHTKAKAMLIKSNSLKEKRQQCNNLYKSGKYREAQIIYTEALKIDPFNLCINCSLYCKRALMNSKLGNFHDAIEDCNKALEINKCFLKALSFRAKCYNDLKEYQKCIDDCDRGLRINSKYLEFRFLKAECLILLGRTNEGQKIAEEAIKINSNSQSIEALYVNGLCLYYKDNLENSINKFKQVLQINSDHIKANAMLVKSKTLADKREQANNLYKCGKFKEAQILYTEALKIDPLNSVISGKLYYNRALMNHNLGNFLESIEDCTKALEINNFYYKALLLRANCYNDLKDYQKCIDDCDKGIIINSKYLEFKFLKAECLIIMGRITDGHKIAEEVMKMNPNLRSIEALYVNGLCLYYNDDLIKCINNFKEVLQQHPNHVKAKVMHTKSKTLKDQREKANNLYKFGKFKEALILYTEALKIDPSNTVINSKLYYNKALMNQNLGNLYESIEDCTRALEIDNLYHKAFLLRAKCYYDVEMYEECIIDCEAALKIEKTKEIENLRNKAKQALVSFDKKDYYEILGVKRNATEEEIRKAYKKKALMHHPDKHQGATATVRKLHEEKFKKILEAHNVLLERLKKGKKS